MRGLGYFAWMLLTVQAGLWLMLLVMLMNGPITLIENNRAILTAEIAWAASNVLIGLALLAWASYRHARRS